MKTIQFIITCDVEVWEECLTLDGKQIKIIKTFIAGEEEGIQEITDRCDGTSLVVFDDASVAILENDFFVATDWTDENNFGFDQIDE